MSPRARQAKGKARLNAYEELLREESTQKIETAEIYIAPGPRLGDVVVEARKLRKGFGDNLLFEDLDFTLPRGGIVGVIGPNGAGKTTLFRMIIGQEKPDAGTLKIGDTVKIAYVDQSRDALDAEQDGLRGDHRRPRRDRARQAEDRLARVRVVVQLQGPDQQKKVGALSGGERNRVHLAKLLQEGGNLLLLDEPTNDLDVDTLRALEEALLNFAGCAVVITPRPLVPGPHRDAHPGLRRRQRGRVVRGQLPGLRSRPQAPLGADADQPHRIKYRRLTR